MYFLLLLLLGVVVFRREGRREGKSFFVGWAGQEQHTLLSLAGTRDGPAWHDMLQGCPGGLVGTV